MKNITEICKPCEDVKELFDIKKIVDSELCRVAEVIEIIGPVLRTKKVIVTEEYCLTDMIKSMANDKFCAIKPSCKFGDR